MSNSASKELILVKDLINEFKYQKALQNVEDIEQKANLTNEEMLRTQVFKGWLYYLLGQFDNSLKIAEELYQKSQELEMPLLSLNALHIKSSVFVTQLRLGKWNKTLKQYNKLFIKLPREDSKEYQEREAQLLSLNALDNYMKGNFDLAIDYCDKSLTLFKLVDPHSFWIPFLLIIIAYAYNGKGELNFALEYNERALSLIPSEEYYFPMNVKAGIYRNMGVTFLQKGDLNSTLEYNVKALEIYKKFKIDPVGMSWAYYFIIYVLILQKNFVQAENYLQQFKQYNEEDESWYGHLIYQYAHAKILKSSSRLHDRVEAENILKKIINENKGIDVTNGALKDLCNWYFKEFQISHQMEILDDIQPLIDHLQRNAKLGNSYSLLANVKLLQAKLALLQVSMVEARKLLTEAQQIAEEHGLQLLAGEISREHDHMLEELKLWESFKKEQATVSERLKLASVDGVMERLQGRRAIKVPEVSVEEPILLLIMDNSGVAYFNHPFVENWDFDDLFSSFMSAFNTFSGEIFSNPIDRVMIADNTILINPIEPFLACYIIKGQSYPAQQKLTRFSDAVKASPEIWEALNRAVKTSEMLELDNPSSLGSVVKEIFV